MGEIKVDLSEFKKKVKITLENCHEYSVVERTGGEFFTLDVRPYYDMFLEFGVNFSGPINDD